MTRFSRHLSNHLLTALVISFSCGISLTTVIRIPPLLLALLTAGTLCLTTLLYLAHRHGLSRQFLVILFCLLGSLHTTAADKPPSSPDDISRIIQEKREAVVIGTLSSMATFNGETGQARIALQSIRFADSPRFTRAEGTVLVSSRKPWPGNMIPGTALSLRLTLQRPSGFNTPGVFNYPLHLARQDIRVTGFVTSAAHIHQLDQPETLLHQIRFLPERWRHQVGLAIDQAVPPPLNGIYRALVIGDQSKVDETTRTLFRDSGVMHILSVSGTHFAIISTLLFILCHWLLRRSAWLILHANTRKLALLACLPTLIAYALLAGMNTPVLRTLIMCCTAVIALWTDRRKSISALLAAAALLILLIDPHALFTASFQLSFAAVASIALAAWALPMVKGHGTASPGEQPWHHRPLRWLIAALVASIAATLGTAPLLLHHFNHVSLVAPLSNLLIEPLICLFSLPLALLACLALPFVPNLAALLLDLGAPALTISLEIMRIFTRLPLSSLWLASPPAWLTLLYYATLLLLIMRWHRDRKIWQPALASFAVIVLFHVFPPYEVTARLKRDLTVTFLDVGQGSATLLEFPGGYRVLVDGGGSSASSRTVGETVIAPFLWHRGITRIDQLVVTHPDADHYNGIPFILSQFSPDSLWISRLAADDQFSQLISQAQDARLQVSTPTDGEELAIGEGGFRCIRNLATRGAGDSMIKGSSNDAGLILQATLGSFDVLLPGDISRKMERQLIVEGRELTSTVLLAPHHGSKTSNSAAFFSAVAPEYLVVSAGRKTTGHFPHPGLQRQCEEAEIRMLTTAGDGTVRIDTDGKWLTLSTYRETVTTGPPAAYRQETWTKLPTAENTSLQPAPRGSHLGEVRRRITKVFQKL